MQFYEKINLNLKQKGVIMLHIVKGFGRFLQMLDREIEEIALKLF